MTANIPINRCPFPVLGHHPFLVLFSIINWFFFVPDPERGGRDGEGPGHPEQRDDLQAALGLLLQGSRLVGEAQGGTAHHAPPASALQTELLAPGGAADGCARHQQEGGCSVSHPQ